MSTGISNTVSSHEVATPGLTPVFTDLDHEPKRALLPMAIGVGLNGLPDVVIVGDAPDFLGSPRFVLTDESPILPEFGEGRDSLETPTALRKSIVPSILIGSVVDDQEFANKLIESDDAYRHWSSRSQRFAPADVLLQYLQDGWEMHNRIVAEVFRCPSRQCAELYYFMLLRGREYVTIPIVANPVVLRLIQEFSFTVIQVYDECDDGYHSESSASISEQTVGLL